MQVAYAYTIGADKWIQIRLTTFIKNFEHPNLSPVKCVMVCVMTHASSSSGVDKVILLINFAYCAKL